MKYSIEPRDKNIGKQSATKALKTASTIAIQ